MPFSKPPLDLQKTLRINMPLIIMDKKGLKYKSAVQDISRDSIAVNAPMRGLSRFFPDKGSVLKFIITVDDGIITFESAVLDKKDDDRIPLYLIAWPRSFEYAQRREHYRQPCTLDALYWKLPPSAEGVTAFDPETVYTLGKPQKGIVVDISGGGLRLASAAKHEQGDLLALHLHLQCNTQQKDLWVRGRIVRCYHPVKGKAPTYQYSIGYFHVPEKIKEEIIRFIFILMREKKLK